MKPVLFTFTRSPFFIILSFIIPPLFWATNYIIGRAVRYDISPTSLTLARWSVALLIALPFAWPHIRRDSHYYLDHPIKIIGISLSGIAVFSILIYLGLQYTTSTNALLLNSFVPILILLFSTLFFRNKVGILQISGLIISTLGVFVIIFKGSLYGLLQLSFSYGDLLLLAAMASFALYTLLLRKVPSEINRMGLLAIQIIITLIVLFPLWLFKHHSELSFNWNYNTLQAALFLGIFPSFCSYILYGYCVEKLGAAKASLSIHLIPVFGVVLSTLLLNEHLYLFHLIGISTILTGIYLTNLNYHQGKTHEKRNN